MPFKLTPLPYKYDALAPYVSEKTMRLHHDALMGAYVDKLNQLLPDYTGTVEHLVVHSPDGAVFNNAAQLWNHAFFFAGLKKDVAMPLALSGQIKADFGSIKQLREAVVSKAVSVFGSGWVWLTMPEDRLRVVTTKDADTPMRRLERPLLAIDVWEHAYYLDYANKRKDYVGNLFDHCVDWDRVCRLAPIPR